MLTEFILLLQGCISSDRRGDVFSKCGLTQRT